MRPLVAVACALFACGCAEESEDVTVRCAADEEQPTARMRMPPPDSDPVDVDFAAYRQTMARFDEPPPHPRIAHSISLGFIGDGRLDRYPTPPHHDPSWARPFPCNWTHTCGYSQQFDPAMLRAYGYPADYPR
jgi:hypothetical protein